MIPVFLPLLGFLEPFHMHKALQGSGAQSTHLISLRSTQAKWGPARLGAPSVAPCSCRQGAGPEATPQDDSNDTSVPERLVHPSAGKSLKTQFCSPLLLPWPESSSKESLLWLTLGASSLPASPPCFPQARSCCVNTFLFCELNKLR